MSNLIAEKFHDTERTDALIFRELKKVLDVTQRRAFDLFQQRGAQPGADLDDWLRAERETVWSPQSELLEDEGEIRLRIAAPGLEPKQIHVTALPETIIVKGETTHKHDGGNAAVQFCEFSEKTLFRRFNLDSRIDVDRVSATLDQGILRIVAPKVKSTQGRQVPVSRA
jgi:HSP20 family protein